VEPVQRGDADEGPSSLSTPSGADVTFSGDDVVKLHRDGTDPQALRRRLRVASRVPALLTPVSVEPELVAGRWSTRWPRVDVVAQDPARLPWAEAAELLARLHRAHVEDPSLAHGAPDRLARALSRLGEGSRADVVRAAADGTHPTERSTLRTLVHGDFHLGQIGRHDGRWVLIDVDDLGVGDPAWDLARPAGFWAVGLIPDCDWHRFLDRYRGAGGPALPDDDPWPVLEPFARAAVVGAAANHPDDDLLLEACARMSDPGRA
jgi:hypothetical protein